LHASGWEKGQVENQVGTGRCNFFTPLVKVENLEELNSQLEKNCIAWAKHNKHPEQKEKTVFEMYQEELPALIPYRGCFDSYKIENDVVSPYCFVRHATNCYSVECGHVGQAVQVRIYAKEIIVIYRDKIFNTCLLYCSYLFHRQKIVIVTTWPIYQSIRYLWR
jgi:Mu transposase-like protein